MKPFYIYLTFDIDQDFNPGSEDYYNRTAGKFDAFDQEFLGLVECLKGKPFSVFVRSDYQIKSLYGSYDYLLRHNPSLIENIRAKNGELNWHIHLYERQGNDWVPVRAENLAACFRRDYEAVRENALVDSSVVRIGECVMTNELMAQIEACGIRIDSTALPGRMRDDVEKHLDWKTTGNRPYHPSAADYRIPSASNYRVMEVPMSTLLMKASYDNVPILRYFNLSFKTDILFQNFAGYVDEHDMIVTITHPFEVIGQGQHGLIAFSKEEFRENLRRLEQVVSSRGKRPVFRHISEVVGP